MPDDLVSVIVPTYYRNDRLRDTIRSVEAQTYDPIETIIVDDSGEACARPVADEFDVRYLRHEENRGANTARTTGIEAADGTYIQLLDDDDRLHREKIARQVTLLDRSDDVGVAYCGLHEEFEQTDRLPVQNSCDDVLDRTLALDFPCGVNSALLIEAELLVEICPLTRREAADDVGMKIELAQRTSFDFVPEILVTKGDTGRHRSGTAGFAREIENILREYRDLYDQRPADVRRRALSQMYRSRGSGLARTRLWSPGAIAAYLKSIHYAETVDIEHVGELVAALFGRPGWLTAAWLHDRLSVGS